MNKRYSTRILLLMSVLFAGAFSSCKDKETVPVPVSEPVPEPEPVTPHNPAGGELLYYDFEDNVADKGEHGYDGILVGQPAFVEGRTGSALYLNEADGKNECDQKGGEYLQVPAIGKVWEKGFTVSAWIEFKENRQFERIIDFGNGLGETNGMNITFSRFESSNDLVLTSWISSDPEYNRTHGRLVAKDVIVNGELQHYAATINPEGVMKIFVNGEKVAEQKNGNPVLNVYREKNYIGHSSYCFLDPDLKGVLDELRIYNKALTEKEIKDLSF